MQVRELENAVVAMGTIAVGFAKLAVDTVERACVYARTTETGPAVSRRSDAAAAALELDVAVGHFDDAIAALKGLRARALEARNVLQREIAQCSI